MRGREEERERPGATRFLPSCNFYDPRKAAIFIGFAPPPVLLLLLPLLLSSFASLSPVVTARRSN